MRELGFYWVLRTGQPEVAEWFQGLGGESDRFWLLTGTEVERYDKDLDVLSERLLPPDWDKGPPIKSET